MPRCEDHKESRLLDLRGVKGLWWREGEGGMSVFFCLGAGVFLYGVFFGGEGSRKKLHVPLLGCIDPSDPDLFSVPDNQKLHGLDGSRRFLIIEKFKGVVGDFLLDILIGRSLGSENVVDDAGNNNTGGHDRNGTTDSNPGDGGEEC